MARWLTMLFLLLQISAIQAADADTYLRQIRPVLQERCVACHGALKQEAGLRLDTVASMLTGGDSGAAVERNSDDTSLLLQRISSKDASERMPPEGEPLSQEQVSLIKTWIGAGAAAPENEIPEEDPRNHWAFQSPVQIPVPGSAGTNPVDAFLSQKQTQLGLQVQPAASSGIWLRRVYLDLTGIPPTHEQLTKFLQDPSSATRSKIVDELLNSSHYGERWGRHWMDIWRYSDWWGLGKEVRNSQKHIWHWRDWIIESLNADKGYDQMLREMLAADELYPTDRDRIRASGYLARQYYRFNRTTWLDDVIQHTFKGMLGLTVNCSKCHDHKYDPISQREYYQLRAYFEPYQVRMDLAERETNFELDGIPRVFDCNADAETWLHIRGDDRNPDKSTPMRPLPPAFLQFEEFPVNQVSLPTAAFRPGTSEHVVEAWVAKAEADLNTARDLFADAESRLNQLRNKTTTPKSQRGSTAKVVAKDSFQKKQDALWEEQGGEWIWKDGILLQNQVSTEAAHLQLRVQVPQDFEATLRYVPIAGNRWKSVGIRFDVAGDDQVTAYLSSVAGGSKVQLSWKQQGQQVYPPAAMQARNVPLNQEVTLQVRIRGRLVNLLVDGELVVSHELPFARKQGPVQLMAFDCQAEFREFQLSTLNSQNPLVPPGGDNSAPLTLREAELSFAAAELRVRAAAGKPQLVRLQAAAERAQTEAPNTTETSEMVRTVAAAEHAAALLEAEADLRTAELELERAAETKKPEATQKVNAAKQSLQLLKSRAEPAFTPLVGALKTPESNVESEESRKRPFPATSTGRRTALANWITSPNNPLTARVAVNHIWNRHFGRGLVSSQFDFGRRGGSTEHQDLLDWLAVEFMKSGWSMKSLHRLIVLSETYARASTTVGASAATLQADPENRMYWRRDSIRMEAEIVRDSLLALSGQLDITIGGPTIPASETASRRRSLYFFHSNNEQNSFLSVFDNASVHECYRRSDSIVPQQALALENSQLAYQTAQFLARLLEDEETLPELNDQARLTHLFEMLLCIPPTETEMEICRTSLAELRRAGATLTETEREERAWTALVLALLNHNDFVTIR